MVEFDPNTLYSLAELKERLREVVELPTFLRRLGLKDNRVFKDAVWGWEILKAARKAPVFSEQDKPSAEIVATVCKPPRGRKSRASSDPLRKLGINDAREGI